MYGRGLQSLRLSRLLLLIAFAPSIVVSRRVAVSASAKTEEELEIEREIEADEQRAKDEHQKRQQSHNWNSVQGDISRDCMKDGSCHYEKTDKGFRLVIDTKKGDRPRIETKNDEPDSNAPPKASLGDG